MGEVLVFVGTVAMFAAVLLAANTSVRFLLAIVRRPLVEKWAQEHRLVLLDVRPAFFVFHYTASMPFRISVRDPGGRETKGIAWATGWLRRRVWVEWE